MAAYPMTRLVVRTYPENPDAWCETLSSQLGDWIGFLDQYSQNDRSIDNVNRVAGTASIKTHSTASNGVVPDDFHGGALFVLHWDALFNGSQPNSKLIMSLFLDNNFTGKVTFSLLDSRFNVATKTLEGLPKGQWLNDLGMMLGAGGGWSFPMEFDWSSINRVVLKCYLNLPGNWPGPGTSTGDFWIDNMHFEYEVIPTDVRINAVLENGDPALYKSVSIRAPSGLEQTYNLTFSATITATGQFTVTVLNSDFIKWEDGTANPIRNFALPSSPIVWTATFQANGTPPSNNKMLIAGAGIGAVIIIGLAYYYLRSKRR